MTVSVNLIPDARVQFVARRKRIRRWVMAGVVYGFILLMGCGLIRMMGDQSNPSIVSDRADVQLRIESIGNSISKIRSHLGEYEQTLMANRDLVEHPDWGLLLALLSDTLGDEMVLKETAIERLALLDVGQGDSQSSKYEGAVFRLVIKGMGRSQSAVSQYALGLEKTNLFNGVKLVDTHLEPFLFGKAVAFSIECRLAGGTK